jgi:hypothetical protein
LKIGKKIWYNECKGTIEGLTTWNEGEEFASLGIGHFLWCPPGKTCPFAETFPELVMFLNKRGAKVPTWIKTAMSCPWKTRAEFVSQIKTPHMLELRTFLANTIDFQTEFLLQRLDNALPKMLKTRPVHMHQHIRSQYERLKKTPEGMFALVDYINFKGEGSSVKERYKGQGWGLVQVLESMQGKEPKSAVAEFVLHAKTLLTKRVESAPRERNESRWLAGWHNRLERYLQS